VPFGHRHSLLGHPVPARELGPPHGRLTGPHRRRTPTGLPRSARTSCDRGGRPLYPGDNGAHPDRGDFQPGACRSTAASPFSPPPIPPARMLLNEANEDSHEVRPSGLPLACGRPGGAGRPWTYASGFAPRRPGADDARRGGDRPSSTDLELPLNSHPSISNPIVHSLRATSRRTSPKRSSAGAAAGRPMRSCGPPRSETWFSP
jgi:hypothetical protein